MIYINNELFKRTSPEDKQSFKEFQEQFQKHLDPTGRIIKPIVLKYTKRYIKPDRDNPGKMMMPRSLKLNFVTTTMYNGQVAEVRYSKASGKPDAKTGTLKFIDNGTQVVGGRLAVNDIDLAYYLWRFSDQIVTKPENASNPLAFFEIENVELERKQAAIKKAIAATLNARLWNSPEDGGLSDETIRSVAKTLMIPHVDEIEDIIELKLILERYVNISQSNADLFLSLTDKKGLPKKELADRRGLIADAVKTGILAQDALKCTFHLVDETGAPAGKPIFTYKKGEKDPKGALYSFLEESNPEFIDNLKERIEAVLS